MISPGHLTDIDLSSQRDWTCLLGAITENGDRFFSRFTEYITEVQGESLALHSSCRIKFCSTLSKPLRSEISIS